MVVNSSININFHNVDKTHSLYEYVMKKLTKSKYLKSSLTVSDVNIRVIHGHGSGNKYEVTVTYTMSGLNRALQVVGSDVYSLIDLVESKLSDQIGSK